MKRGKWFALVVACCLTAISVSACSSGEGEAPPVVADTGTQQDDGASVATTQEEPEEVVAEIPAGMYLSELTGLPIDEALEDQRPIAVMVDNELTALDHYGTAEADIVYEMMNSTQNNRITRLMCIYKDWKALDQVGSIRSTRPTNMLIYPEYDAVLMHDGGPFYIEEYYKHPYNPHISGVFPRIPNNKPYEYTEYIKNDVQSLESIMAQYNYSESYTEYRPEGNHFTFADYGKTVDLEEEYTDSFPATMVDLSPAFPHNSSKLEYNEETGTYDYYEYNRLHVDAEDGEALTFTNVFLQCAGFTQLDDHGYLIYDVLSKNGKLGYYMTGGAARPVYWKKEDALARTIFFTTDATGKETEVEINAGKTYIGIIPEDSWNKIVIE